MPGTRSTSPSRLREGLLLVLGAAALAAVTVYASVQQVGGMAYLESEQILRHESVVTGAGPWSLDPWAYRLLSELGVEALIETFRSLGRARPDTDGFIAFRFVQNVAIFVLAYAFFRRLGIRRAVAALGLGLLAWAMTQSSFGSDLKFDTYGDVIFFLVAALLVLGGPRAWIWIVPLTALAAANRETSAAIPLLLAGLGVRAGIRTPEGRWALQVAGAALAAFAVVYLGIRGIVGPRPQFVSFGMTPGPDIIGYNLRVRSLYMLFATLNVLPILCWWGWRRWPGELRAMALALVPLWAAIHLVAGLVEETRLFLVPAALVFVPGVLLLAGGGDDRVEPRPARGFGHRHWTLATLAGAAVLALAPFGAWYELRPSGSLERAVSAWEYLGWADVAVTVLAVAVAACVAMPRIGPRARVLGALAAGGAAVAVVYRQLVATPGIDVTVHAQWAAYAALAAAVVVVLAGALELLRRAEPCRHA